jgi:hypothetical protein
MENDNSKIIMTQPEKVEHILRGSCDYFGITKEDFFKKYGARSHIWKKKKYIAHILLNHTACNMSEVIQKLGYGQYNNANHHLKQITDELSDDIYGCKKTKMIYNELLSYLNL